MGLEIGGIGGLLILIADIYAIVKTLNARSATTGTKVFWLIVILVLPVFGVIIWFFAGPRE